MKNDLKKIQYKNSKNHPKNNKKRKNSSQEQKLSTIEIFFGQGF